MTPFSQHLRRMALGLWLVQRDNMTEASLESLVSQACDALGGSAIAIGPTSDSPPRFELFNAPNSICSQKVRAVLAHHRIAYLSHSMNMFMGQTYLPQYVRLRMHGCDALGGRLVTEHTGSTSVSQGGCDPAVVPTLVDRQARKVVVDSKRICFYLDHLVEPDAQLRPPDLVSRIDAQLAIVDNLPNYQFLSGKPPGEDTRPVSQRGKTGVEFALGKVARCDHYLEAHADDATLVRAYTAKRAKESNAAERLFGPEAMRAAYDKAEAAFKDLEAQLQGRSTVWLLDDRFTMADMYWAIELLRMQNMGAQRFWDQGRLPAVAAFAEHAATLLPLRTAILNWPGAIF